MTASSFTPARPAARAGDGPSGRAGKAGSGDTISLAARRPLASAGTGNLVVASTGNPGKPSQVTFDRRELDAILRIYGFQVAAGEWRDYAIDHLKERAVFSVFRRASEAPLFTIEKVPARARKQGAYALIDGRGTVVKRGHEIAQVLRPFERRLRAVE